MESFRVFFLRKLICFALLFKTTNRQAVSGREKKFLEVTLFKITILFVAQSFGKKKFFFDFPCTIFFLKREIRENLKEKKA